MDEQVTLSDGLGILELRGGDFDTALLFQGRPITFDWYDCTGSVARYLRHAGVRGWHEELTALRHTVDGGLDDGIPLASQLWPVLRLFTNGDYRLGRVELPPTEVWDLYTFSASGVKSAAVENLYPYGAMLVATQPIEALDATRVRYFRERIEAGVRPLAITATTEHAELELVLDGHHKLTAYREAGVPPSRLTILRLSLEPVSLSDGLAHLAGSPGYLAHYRRHKTESDRFARR